MSGQEQRTFCPERLRLARNRRGILAQELAAKVGVTGRSVSFWEKGRKTPDDANVVAVGKMLDYPVDYFYRTAPPLLGAATFRSLAKMTARQAAQAKSAGVDAVEIDAWIGTHFRRPEPSVPDLRNTDPEIAAEMLRADWGIGSRPLPNLVHLMERHGVRVYSLVHNGAEVDAFSAWFGNAPFVFLNTSKTAERGRMDASHELGHLTLHHHSGEGSPVQEREAQSFAAAFLMPRDAFRATASRRASLPAIMHAKLEWGVSAAAYAYRLHNLELIPYWLYRDLCIKLRVTYGNSEPGPNIDRETSQVLAKVLGGKGEGGATRREIARALCIRMKDLDDVTFGLTLTPVAGGATVSVPSAGHISLVK